MEKTQILIVHGGEIFSKDKDFYEMLTNWNIDPYDTSKSWKSNLEKDVGESYEIFKPSFPNRLKADYNAWKIWFEKHFDFLTSEKIILIGHSLGGLFLAKYLCENKFPQELCGLHLVAPVFDYGVGKHLGNFNFDNTKLTNVSKQCKNIFLYHSTDDTIVPYNHSVEYQKSLENSELITLKNKGHINQEDFPELLERIKKD
jgi:predicted alpha/beta hydrolase family esterase